MPSGIQTAIWPARPGAAIEVRLYAPGGPAVTLATHADVAGRWALTNADLSNEAFRFMRSATIEVAGVTCLAIRVSFTGDLGWELHCAEADQVKLYFS